MNLSNVHDDLKQTFRYAFFPPIHWPGVLWIAKKLYRLPPQEIVPGVSLSTDSIGSNQVRIYRPDSNLTGAAMLMLHGGGLIGGSPDMHDWYGSSFAKELGATVISPAYRTAPEHPAPAAIDDCWSAWNWFLSKRKEYDIDDGRMALYGVSAGGGLAACLSQRILDDGGLQPKACVLHYPMLDDRTAADKALDPVRHILWNNYSNRVGWTSYLGAERVGAHSLPDYLAAARRENLAGLPPTWIGVGDVDLFLAENENYARRLQAAGVSCTLNVVPKAPHGFESLAKDTDLVRDYMQDCLGFLRQHLLPSKTSNKKANMA